MNILNLFPVPVIRQENFLFKEECLEILKCIKGVETHKHPALIGKSESTYDLTSSIFDFFPNHLKSNIVTRLSENLNLFANAIGYPNQEIANSWHNIQLENSILKMHTHPTSRISGALYLLVDENSSDITFTNPNAPLVSYAGFKHETPYSFISYSFKPCVGDLFMFPSWLEHGSNGVLNKSSERIVVSFNSRNQDSGKW